MNYIVSVVRLCLVLLALLWLLVVGSAIAVENRYNTTVGVRYRSV